MRASPARGGLGLPQGGGGLVAAVPQHLDELLHGHHVVGSDRQGGR
ncbi:hypothetical protein [Kitasatospora nipponensis]